MRDETPDCIQQALAANSNDAVFFFLHGRKTPPGIVDGRGGAVISKATTKLLASRVICGTCYSLNAFATWAVAHRATVVGYDGELLIPYKRQRARQMRKAALAAHRALLAGADARTAAEAARLEYQELADMWYGDGTFEGQVHAGLANQNSNAVGMRGVASTKI